MAEAKKQPMRFTDEELNVLRGVFGGNEKLVKLMRKIFLPTIDLDAPIHQMIDMYMSLQVTTETSPEEVKIALLSRNHLIAHIEQCLAQITVLSQPELPTEANPKDSAK